MCVKNKNIIIDIDLATASDAINWATNASNVVSMSDDKLRLIPDDESTVFERSLGSLSAANNRLLVNFDFDVFRPSASTQDSIDVVFSVLRGSTLMGVGSASITSIQPSQVVKFNLDRTFEYDGVSGGISLKISVTNGYSNYVDIKKIKVEDFNFCDNDVRTYFIFEDLFENSLTANSAAIKLNEWKVDDVETLTSDFFSETNNIIISYPYEWLFADSDINGDNRAPNSVSPKTFNPFSKLWNLEFTNPTPYYAGKPTGSKSGKDYGSGILNIGLCKPKVLNASLEHKSGAFFIDIDFTKNLRISVDVVVNQTNASPFVSPEYYRKFYIIWNAKNCESKFYYEDKIDENKIIEQNHNGFLYGITDSERIEKIVECNEVFSALGESGSFEYTLDFGTRTGEAGIDYDAYSAPDKFTLIWNGQEVTSGYVGSNIFDKGLINAGVKQSEINTGNPTTGAGKLSIYKNSAYPTTATVKVDAPLSTQWEIKGICPRQLSTSPVEIGIALCGADPSIYTEVHIDNNDVLTYTPVNGDVVYTDVFLSSPFDGNNETYRMRLPTAPIPTVTEYTFVVDDNGIISNVLACVEPVYIVFNGVFENSCTGTGNGSFEVTSGKLPVFNDFILESGSSTGQDIQVTNTDTGVVSTITSGNYRHYEAGNYRFTIPIADCASGISKNKIYFNKATF